MPNVDSPALVNFAYVHAGAAATEEEPIILHNLTLLGAGHGIAIGELVPKELDSENPVRWLRVEDCTFANPEGRSDYRLFLLNDIEDIFVTHNTFSDPEIGISMLFEVPNQSHRIKIHQNTFHNLESLITFDANFAQDKVAITSNLISHVERVTPGQLTATALPTAWFSGNAWLDDPTTTDSAVSSVAKVADGITFRSVDPANDNFMRPTPDSRKTLRAFAEAFPGRFESE